MKENKLAKIISGEIKKVAWNKNKSGHNINDITLEYEDVELQIDGKKKECDISLEIELEFDWYIEKDTYWEQGDSGVKNIKFWITKINIGDKEGVVYTEEQEDKILEDNRKYLDDLIEYDVEEKAEEVDWQESEPPED